VGSAIGFRTLTVRRIPAIGVCWYWAGDRWRSVDPEPGDVALMFATVRRKILHQRCMVLDVGVDPNVTANPVRYDTPDGWGR